MHTPGFSRTHPLLLDAAGPAALFAMPKPYLTMMGFQGMSCLGRKENSSQRFGGCLPVTLCYHIFGRNQWVSTPRFGNINRIPFWTCPLSVRRPPRQLKRMSLCLRIDSPMFNCCSHGTLLHIGPPGLLWSICYCHQDLQQGQLQPSLRSEAFGATPATFLLI